MNSLITRPRLFDDFFKDFSSSYLVRPLLSDPLSSLEQIKIDVTDNGEAFVVRADMPGVNKEDLHVDIEGNYVSLRAEVNQVDNKKQDNKIIYTERYSGVATRSFSLPAEISKDKAKAKYENGVLILTLPKTQNVKLKHLQIE